MKKTKHTILPIAALAGLALVASSAHAATINVVGGDITTVEGWDNGLPTAANPGSISVDGVFADDTWGFGKDTVITQTTGILDGDSKTMNFGAFNGTDGGGTWNMSGGTIIARSINLNSTTNSTMNISGGSLVLNSKGIELDKGATISSSKSGSFLNISGTAILDETNATKERNGADSGNDGNYDIASDWTGYWTCGFYDGDTDAWKNFVVTNITLDNAAVDSATFDSTFTVTDNGQRLALIPEPSSAALLGLGGLALIFRRRK